MGRRRQSKPPPEATRRTLGPRVRPAVALAVMVLGILAVYYPLPERPTDNALFGIDYHQLHARRIRFAQGELFGAEGAGALPGWYPRELTGTPFWSNIQNFPFIPTRLVLVLASDPLGALYAGVNLAAVLSGAFTFLYARRVGLGATAAAGAGWTFACAGFFASRVMAGHLPLLEAYPALPLLLWLGECWLRPGGHAAGETAGPTRQKLTLLALGLSTTCVALAGHPQLPFYAIAGAAAYLLYRGPFRRALRGLAAMVAGGLCAAFAHVPFLMLVRRSTRILALDPAVNDIALPYRRLGAMLLPWKDGQAESVVREAGQLFKGFPNDAYFWETVHYIGWLPWLAAAWLLVRQVRRGSWRAPALFFAVVGVLALLTALPFVQDVVSRLPGTLLRSPSRQLYFTAFALALGLGTAVDLTLRYARPGRPWPRLAAAVVLAVHALDLGVHDRAFVRMITIPGQRGDAFEQGVRQLAGPTGRVAMDYTIPWPANREVDDVGLFDSVMLARPYAALLALSGQPPTLNVQELNGADMTVRALQAAGVHAVFTQRERPDLALLGRFSGVQVYGVPVPLPRATFFPAAGVMRLARDGIDARLRDPRHDLHSTLMLEGDAPAPLSSATIAAATGPATAPSANIRYARPSPDEISLKVNVPTGGFLRVLEAWDPGWRAMVDRRSVDPVPADGFSLAVPVPAGSSDVLLTFSTPGRNLGILVSLGAAGVLALVAFAPLQRAATFASAAPDGVKTNP